MSNKLREELENIRESISQMTPDVRTEEMLFNTDDIEALNVVTSFDYQAMLRESNLDTSNILKLLAIQIMGERAAEHSWVREEIKFNTSKLAPLHNNIKILQNRITSTSTLLDLGADDEKQSVVLTMLMDSQMKNIRLATNLKKEFEQSYNTLADRLESNFPELFAKQEPEDSFEPEDESKLKPMDSKKMNEILLQLKEKAKKQTDQGS